MNLKVGWKMSNYEKLIDTMTSFEKLQAREVKKAVLDDERLRIREEITHLWYTKKEMLSLMDLLEAIKKSK